MLTAYLRPVFLFLNTNSDKKGISIQLDKSPSKDEQRRVDDIQLAISTVIISLYFSISTSESSIHGLTGSIMAPIAGLAAVFLSIKLAMALIRPYCDPLLLQRIDYIALPFSFFFWVSLVFISSLSSIPKIC